MQNIRAQLRYAIKGVHILVLLVFIKQCLGLHLINCSLNTHQHLNLQQKRLSHNRLFIIIITLFF